MPGVGCSQPVRHCRTSFRFQPEPIEQLETDAAARFAATPLNSHPPSSPIDVPKPAAPHLGGWPTYMAIQTACMGASQAAIQSASHGAVWLIHRPWPPSTRPALQQVQQQQPRAVGCIGRIIQETNVPAGREGVALSPSHGRLPAKHSKPAKLCQRNAWLRRCFVCLPACWDVGTCCVFAPPPQCPDTPGPLPAQLPA